jgi:hypothetical protein
VEAGEAAQKREIFVSHGAGAGNFQVMARSAGSTRRDKRAWRARREARAGIKELGALAS